MPLTFLDTAIFPGADACHGACLAAGAHGFGAYVYDLYLPEGNGGWTPQACAEVIDRGLGVLPIYLVRTGDQLPIGHAREILAAYGWTAGPVAIDIEGGAMPSVGYVNAWCDDLRAHGFAPIVYGLASTIQAYATHASGTWVASYVYKHVIPALTPDPYGAWQYANSIDVAGVNVDVNTSNLPMIGLGSAQPAPEEDEMPSEVPGPHFPKVQPADCPLDLFNGVNTAYARVYVRLRAYTGTPATATIVLVRDTGEPQASDLVAPAGTAAVEWQLPLNEVGNLVLQQTTAPVSVSVKFGKL